MESLCIQVRHVSTEPTLLAVQGASVTQKHLASDEYLKNRSQGI